MGLGLWMNDDVCPYCGRSDGSVFSANITHNLNKMAAKAGLYEVMWRPEEIDVKLGKDAFPILEQGLARLKAEPKFFRQFNAPNGWGKYENLVRFVEGYLDACKRFPNAEISISR